MSVSSVSSFNIPYTHKNPNCNIQALKNRWAEKFGYFSDLPQKTAFSVGTGGFDFHAAPSGEFKVLRGGQGTKWDFQCHISSDLFEKIADDPALIEKYEKYIEQAMHELNNAHQAAEKKDMAQFIRGYSVSVKPDGSFQAGIRMWNTYLFNYNNVVRQSEWNGRFRTSRLYPEDLEHIGHSPEFITGGSFGAVFSRFNRILEGIPDGVIKVEIEVKPNRDTFTFFEYDYRNRKKPTIFDFL